MAFDVITRFLFTDSGLSAGLAKANNALNELGKAGPGARRGINAIETGLRGLAFEAVGVQGPLGRVAEGLLKFGGGGALVLGAAAGVGAIAAAYKLASKEADNLRTSNENLAKQWRDIVAAGKPLVALQNDITEATKKQSDAQDQLNKLQSSVRTPRGRVTRGTPGEIAAAEEQVSRAGQVVDALKRKLDDLTIETAREAALLPRRWVDTFVKGIKDLDLRSQITSLLAVQNDPRFAATGREGGDAWMRQFVAQVRELKPAEEIRALLGAGTAVAQAGRAGAQAWTTEFLAAIEVLQPTERMAALVAAEPVFRQAGAAAGMQWGEAFGKAAAAVSVQELLGRLREATMPTGPLGTFRVPVAAPPPPGAQIPIRFEEFGRRREVDPGRLRLAPEPVSPHDIPARERFPTEAVVATSLAVLGALQVGAPGGIVSGLGGLAGALGGVKELGILGPIGLGLTALGGVISLFDRNDDKRQREQLEELRRIRQNTDRRDRPDKVDVHVYIDDQEVTDRVMYAIRRAEREDATPRLPPR